MQDQYDLIDVLKHSGYSIAIFLIFIGTVTSIGIFLPNSCNEASNDYILCVQNDAASTNPFISWLDEQLAGPAPDASAAAAHIRRLEELTNSLALPSSLPGTTGKKIVEKRDAAIAGRYEQLLLAELASDPTDGEQDAAKAARLAGAASGRVTWITAYAMLVAVLVATIAACLFSIAAAAWSETRPYGARTLLFIGCLLALTSAIYVSGWPARTASEWLRFDTTALQLFVEQHLEPKLEWHLKVTDGLFVAAAFLILTLVALRVGELSRTRYRDYADYDERAIWLGDSRYLISRLALLLMLILIVSVAHAQALLAWPLAQIGGCETTRAAGSPLEPVCGMIGHIVTSYGIIASFVLGSILLPGVALLGVRVRTLAAEADPSDPAGWIERKKLAVSGWDQAGRLLLVLAPLLSGLLATYVSGATQLVPGSK